MKKWIFVILMAAFFTPVRSQETIPENRNSREARIDDQREETERKMKETGDSLKKAGEKLMRMQDRVRQQVHRQADEIRIKAQLDRKRSDAEDSLFRIDIQIGSLDSILKNVTIPKTIDINEHRIRILEDSLHRFRGRRPPRPTERQGIVKFGEDVIVGRNDRVAGDVVVVDGNAVIYGMVEGGVVVVKGDIKLASTGWVNGDMVCVWGNTEVDPGAHAGSTSVFNIGKVMDKIFGSKLIPAVFLVLRLLRTVLLLAVAMLIIVAFPEQTRRVRRYIEKGYFKSLAAGLIIFLILPFLFVVLIITVLGIPIAVLLLPLAIAGAFLLGITAMAYLSGEWLLKRCGCCNKSSAVLSTTVGILLFEIPSYLGKPISLMGPLFSIFAILVGIALFLMVWTPAFGAAVLTRFGKAPKNHVKMERP